MVMYEVNWSIPNYNVSLAIIGTQTFPITVNTKRFVSKEKAELYKEELRKAAFLLNVNISPTVNEVPVEE